jgi:protein-disulfide isomerase
MPDSRMPDSRMPQSQTPESQMPESQMPNPLATMRRAARALAAAVLLIFPLLAGPATAVDFTPAQRAEIVRILREALKQDPSILRDAVQAMKDDDMRREADASRAAIAAHRSAMVTPDDPVAGNPKGAVTIVEFYDTRCPYCRKIEPTMEQLLTQDHDVRLVYKDLPILGPASVLAAHVLLAAQQQNGYEKLRTALMQAPPDYTKEQILAIARKVGLDDLRLARDMDSASINARLDANLRLAGALGIDGTPALVIGDALVPGAIELADLEQAVATARAAR